MSTQLSKTSETRRPKIKLLEIPPEMNVCWVVVAIILDWVIKSESSKSRNNKWTTWQMRSFLYTESRKVNVSIRLNVDLHKVQRWDGKLLRRSCDHFPPPFNLSRIISRPISELDWSRCLYPSCSPIGQGRARHRGISPVCFSIHLQCYSLI